MNRDELLAHAALASRGSTRWSYSAGEGWSRLEFVPEGLEAMSDAALEGLISQRATSRLDPRELALSVFPGLTPAEAAEFQSKPDVCVVCGTDIDETAEVYLVWDEHLHEWWLYCAEHPPATYWRHRIRTGYTGRSTSSP